MKPHDVLRDIGCPVGPVVVPLGGCRDLPEIQAYRTLGGAIILGTDDHITPETYAKHEPAREPVWWAQRRVQEVQDDMSLTTPAEVLESIGVRPSFEWIGQCRDDHQRQVAAFRDRGSGAIFLGMSSHITPETYAQHELPSEMSADDVGRRWNWLIERFPMATLRPCVDVGGGRGEFVAGISSGPDAPWEWSTWDPANGDVDKPLGARLLTMWHVVEHMVDPVGDLSAWRRAAGAGAFLVVETPNANDWLLHNCPAALAHSLWSQHLIVHTVETLRALLEAAGWRVVDVDYVQRYHLGNHLHWLAKGRPGGHREWACMDTLTKSAYAETLRNMGQSDTLIAYAVATGE